MTTERFLTGITTSGTPHLGNYVGSIRPAVRHSLRPGVESFYFLADYHALIKIDEPARIQRSTLEIAASWLAAGLDPDRVVFYRQSDIPEIPELTWFLTCVLGKGVLNRAHAYKAAVDKNTAAGIDPLERIVIVTDPGSPLDKSAREAGYKVFNADPNVGGRFSALTAFGLVPSGLAGVDIDELLNEAEAVELDLAIDSEENPGLILGAAIAGTSPLKNKLGLVTDGTHLVGFPDWAEQLIAESTGKEGTGILPVVLDVVSPELTAGYSDLQILRLVDDAHEAHLLHKDRHEGEILVSGTLAAMFLVFEYATAVAGRLLGINPFDQPDVESAKVAARALLDARPEATAPLFVNHGIEVRAHGDLGEAKTVREAITAALEQLPADGYVSVQAYIDRVNYPEVFGVRDLVAARAGRPVTFGWGPRFLHSTGQFHKGGPATGVFIQILQNVSEDLEIPERPFTFGQLIAAQAAGDAEVLAQHGRPVLTLTLTNPNKELVKLFEAFN